MDENDSENKVQFQLEGFEGPLDLLLYLIKKSEINIYDIPIAQITEQYLAFLNYITKIDLENLTEFYLMAATLLYIKSQMLLPVETHWEEDFEDPRKDLVEKLIEYQKYKKLSELIAEKEKDSEWLLERKKTQMVLPFPEDDFWEETEIWDLFKMFSSIMTSLSSERIINLYEEVTVNEKITLIREILEEKGELLFTELIKIRSSISDIICSFLAILELAKARQIIIYQNKLFGDIRIKAVSGVN